MKDARTGRAIQPLLLIVLIVYSIVTILPFYFLLVRSFVPTTEATRLHLWIPPVKEVNLNIRFGDLLTYYNLDGSEFKERFGLSGYIKPTTRVHELLAEEGIPEEGVREYLQPYIRFNGLYTIIHDGRYMRSFISTVILTSLSIAVGGFLGVATGAVLARLRKRWHVVVYNIYLLAMIIPFIMIAIPLYILMTRYLHLGNTYLALFLNFIKGGALEVMIFTGYLGTIPRELRDSVYVDGGNWISYFFRILLPLSSVPFATYTAIRFPFFWNNLLLGKLFLVPEKYTLMPLIDSFRGTFTTNYQAIFSGLTLSIIPIFLIYFSFQKLFVRAQLSGAVKG